MELEIHPRKDRRHVAGAARRRAARPDEADEAPGSQRRRALQFVEGGGGDAQRGADARRRRADAADRPADLSLLRVGMVNGPAWKALIEEEFGDGIMSAIDFDMQIERLPNPKGDRV